MEPGAAAIGQLRTVPPAGEIVQTARALGISFGDEPVLGGASS